MRANCGLRQAAVGLGLAVIFVVEATGTVRAGNHRQAVAYYAVPAQAAAPVAYAPVQVASYAPVAYAPAAAMVTMAAPAVSYAPVATYAPVSYAPAAYAPAAYAPAAQGSAPAAAAPTQVTQYQWKLVPVTAATAAAPRPGFGPSAQPRAINDETTRNRITSSMRERLNGQGASTTVDDLAVEGRSVYHDIVNRDLNDDEKADIQDMAVSVRGTASPQTPNANATDQSQPAQPQQQVMMVPVQPQVYAAPALYYVPVVKQHHFKFK